MSVPRTEVAARYAGLLLEYRGMTMDDVFEAVAAIEVPLVGKLITREDPDAVQQLRLLVEVEAVRTGRTSCWRPRTISTARWSRWPAATRSG